MGQTGGETDDGHECIMPLPYGSGGIINLTIPSMQFNHIW